MHSSQPVNWVIGPAVQCVQLIVEEIRVAQLLSDALVALAGQGPLLRMAAERLLKAGASELAKKTLQLQESQQTPQNWAKEIIEADYDVVNRHGLIGLWVAIEVAVEDTATLVLKNDPAALSNLASQGYKLPSEITLPPSEEDSSRIFKRLERQTRQGRTVTDGYIELLGVLGISISVSDACKAVTSELNFVRNCILHRSGVVDSGVHVEAPMLGLAEGDQIRVPRDRYLRYYDAAAEFAQALLKAVFESRHVRTI